MIGKKTTLMWLLLKIKNSGPKAPDQGVERDAKLRGAFSEAIYRTPLTPNVSHVEMKEIFFLLLLLVASGCGIDSAPHWDVERDAVRSDTHPYGGFWKSDLDDQFGLAIGPHGNGRYYVSFCGPGGCFSKGDYRPITTLTNDANYRVLDLNTIDVRGKAGFTTYRRSPGRETLGMPNTGVVPTR